MSTVASIGSLVHVVWLLTAVGIFFIGLSLDFCLVIETRSSACLPSSSAFLAPRERPADLSVILFGISVSQQHL